MPIGVTPVSPPLLKHPNDQVNTAWGGGAFPMRHKKLANSIYNMSIIQRLAANYAKILLKKITPRPPIKKRPNKYRIKPTESRAQGARAQAELKRDKKKIKFMRLIFLFYK